MSFLPLNVFAEEGQEAGETPEITENSTPAEGKTDGDAVPAEGKETTPEEPETTAPENRSRASFVRMPPARVRIHRQTVGHHARLTRRAHR